ncbi:MAG: hypothetical protein FJW64_04100 [Actinobacteria bacterium]|nr:hypothetical protein [Actinomycetota bacterium]
MIRAIVAVCLVIIAVLVAPHAYGNPAMNAADLIVIAAPLALVAVILLGPREPRPRRPWIADVGDDHPDALGSLDYLERRGRP